MDRSNSSVLQHTHANIVTEFLDSLLTVNTPFTIVLIVLYAITFIVGLTGNSLVILVLLKFGYMRTLTNVLLVNLSVGNLLVVLVCMPFSLAPYIYKVC